MKLLLLILIYFSGETYANLEFQLEYNEGQTATVIVGEEGEVEIEADEDLTQEVRTSIIKAVQSAKVYDQSIDSVRGQITKQLSVSTKSQFNVDFNLSSNLSTNEFLARQQNEFNKFEVDLYSNISNPEFYADVLNTSINFDAKSVDDSRALQIYRNAEKMKATQLGPNLNFQKAEAAKSAIEVRQKNRESFSNEELNAFSDIADSYLSDNPLSLINAYNILLRSYEFKKGLGSSIMNNINPLGSVFPISPDCKSDWCEAGQVLGDGISMILGAAEMLSGLTIAIGGAGTSGLSVAFALPSAGASILALPASVTTTALGIAVAGHGASSVLNGFRNLYQNLGDLFNKTQIKKSNQLINDLKNIGHESFGRSEVAKIKDFLQSTVGKKWENLRTNGVSVFDNGFKFFKKEIPLSNDMPSNGIYARVVDKKYAARIRSGELGLSRSISENEAFVTAFDDVATIANPSDYAKKLSLYTDSAGKNLVNTKDYVILKFKFKSSIEKSLRTPIEKLGEPRGYGFIPGGTTAGGAREWLIDSDAAQVGIIEFID